MTRRRSEQLTFEGLEITGLSFQLKGTANLAAEQEYSIGDILAGTWKGVVTGISFDRKEGVLVRKHVIEVDAGSIDG